MIRCPVCGALFSNPREVDEPEGTLSCSLCSAHFPVHDGVFYGLIPTVQPEKEIRVLLDRHLFWQNMTEGTLEAEFRHVIDLAREEARTSFKDSLEKACKSIMFSQNPTVLVSGSGAREVGVWMAEKGARTVVLDYYPQELLTSDANYLEVDSANAMSENLRYVVAFPWRLPFSNEQFDVVLHLYSTPCPIPFQRLTSELIRVLKRKGKFILFWGQEASQPMPRGDEKHGFLVEPRTYNPTRNPGKSAANFSLIWGGLSQIHTFESTLSPDEKEIVEDDSGDENWTSPPPRTLRAITFEGIKRKKSRAHPPQKNRHIEDFPEEVRLFPHHLAKWQEESLFKYLDDTFRDFVPERNLSERIDCGKNLGFWNQLGWRHVENIGTEMARYPFSHSFCFLKGNPDAQTIKIFLFGIPRRVSKRYKMHVEINGTPLELDNPIIPGWQTRTIDISSIDNKALLEVHFHQEHMFRLSESFAIFDYRSLGVGIKRITVE